MIPGFIRNQIFPFILIFSSYTVKGQVKANFTANAQNGCAPLIVKFSNQSTGNPDTWKWDLGNGTISFLQNPSVIYFNPGKYTVKLVVKGLNGADSILKTDFIEVYEAPAVNFSVNKATGCFPLDVQFTDLTTNASGSSSSWLWDFGDGNTSTLKNPSHTYTSDKNFNVTLQVKSSNGCSSIYTQNSAIQISSGAISNFTIDNNKTCTAPVTINFQNTSTGTGNIQYAWSFGDGTTSVLPNPSHSYNSVGTYTVSLVSINEKGCRDTLVKTNAVTVGQVKAGIKTDATICENMAAQITQTSSPQPASVKWSFGDGTTSTVFNPIKTYAAPGNYNIKLVANFGACIDSTIKSITVSPKPNADFTASKTIGCATPFSTNFSAVGTGIVSYLWDFGDSTSSTAATPAHTYTTPGTFTVKLIVTNSNGCTDTIVKKDFIAVKIPGIGFNNLPDSNCAPFTKSFSANITTTDPVTGYLWNFGDGSTSILANPSHSFLAQGVYPITLAITTAQGCTATATLSRGIIVNTKPAVNFTASPLYSCAKDTLHFSDLSDTTAVRWLWQFGDGVSSTMHNTTHQYIDTGYFDIQLTVWNGGCADSLTIKKYIHINAPVAKYQIAATCAKPYERVFTDFSIGADEWQWDFGDGTTSTQQNPVHVYTATGDFVVSLKVINHASGCDYTASRTIRVVNPAIDFTSKDTAVCKGSNVNLTTSLSLNDIATFTWDFGDGSSPANSDNGSNGKTYAYSKTGTFDVKLITTDVNGCSDTLIKPAFIHVSGAYAKFGVSATGSCLNAVVSFSDSTTTDGIHPIKSWVWNYGDGTTDSLFAAPFQHNYNQTGVYPVTLSVYNGNGCKDTYKLGTPIVVARPTAGLSTADSLSCPGKQVRFISQSTGTNIKHFWSFGDNSYDTTQNPAHIFAADAAYTIKLVVTDQYGCKDSVTRQNYISIKTPAAQFIMSDSTSNCPPLIIKFTDLSTNAKSWLWDFGDSTSSNEINPTHIYNFAGNFTVTLTVTGSGGCTAVYKKKVDIKGPKGSFTYQPTSGCTPVTVAFKASTNVSNVIIWDFNDGTILDNSTANVSHTYTYAGSYIPKMILMDQSGCKVPIPGKDTVKVSGVKAYLSFNRQVYCDSAIVSYTDSSIAINDAITSYKWAFGDGSSSGLQNPVHQFATPGLYYPKLVVKTSIGCADSILSSVPVKFINSPRFAIDYGGNGCVPLIASFTRRMLQTDTSQVSWQWDFANGNVSNAVVPPAQKYSIPGMFTVTLVGTNSSGCKNTVNKLIEAYAIPAVNAGVDTILCKGSSIGLKASGAVTYTWSPSNNLLCTNCAATITNTPNNIAYAVAGASEHGCIGRDTVKITVIEKFALQYSRPDSVCKGDSKQLSASGAYAYTWYPSSSLDDANISNPIATPDTSTTYRVVAVDERGCFKDTAYIPVKVNLLPTVEAGADKTINVGQTIELTPQVSDDVINADWQPTSGIFRNSFPGITVKPKENTEYFVEVKNRGGCKAKDRVTVFVVCNGANIFMPNTFSPNNDGVNDVFYPRGTGLFKIKNLKIYDRWGVLVFDRSSFNANNPSEGWNGKNKGVILNPDVFVYTIEVICDNGTTIVYRGNVALIK